MYIDNDTKLRVNINAPYKGFSRLETAEQRAAANVVEIPDPVRGDESFYYNTEQDDAPYLVVTPKSVESVREMVKARAKAIRQQMETAGFPYMGKTFDSDERSAIKINTAVQTAQVAGPSFTINWTAQDDTDVTMDQAAMFGMPVALATYANALHVAYRAHKTAINEADFDTLLAYDVTTGWPE
jgi:hypothetical protein